MTQLENFNKDEIMGAREELHSLRSCNYSDPRYFKAIVANYGGEELLKKKYPRILKMLEDSRAYNLKTMSTSSSEQQFGLQDIIDLEILKNDPNKKNVYSSSDVASGRNNVEILYANSKTNYVNTKAFLMVTNQLVEKHSGKTLGGYSKYEYNISKFSESTVADPNVLISCEKRDIYTSSIFQAVEKNEYGNDISHDVTRMMNVFMLPGTDDAIESVNVEKPKEKDEADVIKIVYNERDDSDAAYKYSKVKPVQRGDRWYVNVALPLKGSVTFSSDFVIEDKILNEYFMCSLSSKLLTGGVSLNTAEWSNIQFSQSASTLYWEFPEQWSAEMELKNYEASSIFDLYMRMYVNVRPKGVQTTFAVPFVVTSEDIQESNSFKKIKKLNILWGCLGKKSKIELADGSSKAVQEVRLGDKVLSADGSPARVVDVITGMEETMILVQAGNKEALLLSETHPIRTERGMIMASNLNAADMILTTENTYMPINHLERVDYNDKVYSLKLDMGGVNHFANGIVVGDYETSCDKLEEEKAPEPIEKELASQLEEWSYIMDQQFKTRTSN